MLLLYFIVLVQDQLSHLLCHFSAYIYGSVSILVISLLSLGGAAFLPLLRSRAKHRWFQVFIALGVATLTTDAILHMIPEVPIYI